jgi:hypothetical protein
MNVTMPIYLILNSKIAPTSAAKQVQVYPDKTETLFAIE